MALRKGLEILVKRHLGGPFGFRHRDDFSVLIDRLDLRIGTELGTAAGCNALSLLSKSSLSKLYCVDKWDCENHPHSEMEVAKKQLLPFGARVSILRTTFQKALSLFPDGYFDFIYIDGYAHSGQEDGQTLWDWYPKLRSGGVFSGHDYCLKWSKTVNEVDRFMRFQKKRFYLTSEKVNPSWYTVK